MSDFIARLLTGLAGLMDKYIPGQGARTYTTVAIAIIAHVSMFLIHQETAQVASTSILGLVSVVFAALHQTTPPPPPAA